MHGWTKFGLILIVTGVLAAAITAFRERTGMREVITSSVTRTAVIAALLVLGVAAVIIGQRTGAHPG